MKDNLLMKHSLILIFLLHIKFDLSQFSEIKAIAYDVSGSNFGPYFISFLKNLP